MTTRPAVSAALLVAALAAGGLWGLSGCKKRVSQAQCDELVDKFATLVVKEHIKDASPEMIKAEQERERGEAKNDDSFRNCTSEVSTEDYACAMKATTSEALVKCLE